MLAGAGAREHVLYMCFKPCITLFDVHVSQMYFHALSVPSVGSPGCPLQYVERLQHAIPEKHMHRARHTRHYQVVSAPAR